MYGSYYHSNNIMDTNKEIDPVVIYLHGNASSRLEGMLQLEYVMKN